MSPGAQAASRSWKGEHLPRSPQKKLWRRNWCCLSHVFVGLCHSSRRTLAEEQTGGKPIPALMEPVFWLFLQQQLFSQYTHTDTQ